MLPEDAPATSPVEVQGAPPQDMRPSEPASPEAPEPAAQGGEEPKPAEEPKPSNKRWYVVKVQSGREESIREAIERRVKIEGLEEYFGQIIIPVERVTEMGKNNKR